MSGLCHTCALPDKQQPSKLLPFIVSKETAQICTAAFNVSMRSDSNFMQ